MSIFRESFPEFIVDELDRRQDGMRTRPPGFLHELNTRSAWVRMTSGVNTVNSKNELNNELATKYVLQGGTLLNNTSLRKGLGGNATSTYDRFSPGGTTENNKHRLGIRPMPGITNVSIASKGAYGSLQEATVNFIAWDIRQLEDLELLYMRPGYTVLLEFGWNYIKPTIPQYDILNKKEISLNKAFAEIYKIIEDSNGNYDALLGYVKNYNWSARDDGGYDCTTTIISLGEVLESLKCNWIPMETVAFTNTGLLAGSKDGWNNDVVPNNTYPDNGWDPWSHYEQGIIPGLLAELFHYMETNAKPKENSVSYAREVKDSKYTGSKYQLFMMKQKGELGKFNRGGLPQYLAKEKGTEGYITLGSFCELLNNYVLLKDINNKPLSQVTTYELDINGNTTPEEISKGVVVPRSLRCLASPLSLSTNYGVCLVRNDNWKSLNISVNKNEAQQDEEETETPTEGPIPEEITKDILEATFPEQTKTLSYTGRKRFKDNNLKEVAGVYSYVGPGNIESVLDKIVDDLLNAINRVDVIKVNNEEKLGIKFTFSAGPSFIAEGENAAKYIDFFNYFYFGKTTFERDVDVVRTVVKPYDLDEKVDFLYDAFFDGADGVYDSDGVLKTEETLKSLIRTKFSRAPITGKIRGLVEQQTVTAATNVAEVASQVPGLAKDVLPFLVQDTTENGKSLGYISNIYVNMDFLYDQAISRNVASNDTQGKNTIAIREYIQNVLRQVQNSIGNINSFDIQVDERNAVGRIIDINFTGSPELDAYELQIHNLSSVVRNYKFSSKIFPEMGSIIAISAQDPTAIGKMGYDNATLVAWNAGVQDRLIPKKDFASNISLAESASPSSFILPFLTKIYAYFKALDGEGENNDNLSYGGLDYSYRDFLANLSRFNPQNNFTAIIPTELSVEMDGIGGIVIGNIFTINQDIVPKGYQSVTGRKLGYLVGKLGHSISNNDWITNIYAYPIILETSKTNPVWKKWNGQEYPGTNAIVIRGADGKPLIEVPILDVYIPKNSNIPVVKYLQGLNRKNGELLKEDLKPVTKGVGTNNNHQLFPSAAYQWEKLVDAALKAGFTLSDVAISDVAGAAYRSLSQQKEGFGRAPKGSSIHGWGAAVDIQSLVTYQRSFTNIPVGKPPAGADSAAKVRAGSKFYQWLNNNAAKFGFINPPKLKDGTGADESWHWEYWGPINGQDGPFTGGAIGQEEKAEPAPVTPQYIIAILKGAEAGAFSGTDEQGIIDAINLIQDKKAYIEVNKLLDIQKYLNKELGVGDANTANQIKAKLATLGIRLTYTLFGSNSVADGTIKIVF